MYRYNYDYQASVEEFLNFKWTLVEAMFDVGIESRSYFTSSFKKEFGMTPSKFASKQNSSE